MTTTKKHACSPNDKEIAPEKSGNYTVHLNYNILVRII